MKIDNIRTLRLKLACLTCRYFAIALAVSFVFSTCVAAACFIWVDTTLHMEVFAQVVAVVVFIACVKVTFHTAVRRSDYAKDVLIGPHINTGNTQAAIHVGSMANSLALRSHLRVAIPGELQLMGVNGINHVSMESPLIGNDALRKRLVANFNHVFETTGMPWKAIDSGAAARWCDSGFFMLGYYKSAYISEHAPNLYLWLKRWMNAAPSNHKTWEKFERDADKNLQWGTILFTKANAGPDRQWVAHT